MKKVLLFLVILLAGQTTFAQINDIYINDGVVLSGNQWHFDNYSVIEANNGNYLVVSPSGYNYQYLPAFVPRAFENRYHERVLSFKPYVFNNCLGWYVNCSVHNYFYYPNGTLVTLSYVPVFHNFYYTLRHLRHINLRNWHWRRPGYYYRPQPYHPPHNYYRPPYQHHPNGNVTRPPQQHHPNGNVSRPPQQHRPNGNVSRPTGSRNNSQQVRPPQNHRRDNSSGRSSNGSQHRR